MRKKPSELTIIIIGDYTHEPPNSEFENKLQRIEKASFYLQTLFAFIKTSARFLEGEAQGASDDLGFFCNNLITLSEVGLAMSNSILLNSSELYDFQLRHDTANAANPNAAFIAERISYLINCEAVPAPIREALKDAMTEFQNDHIDQTEFNEESVSAEFIERLLKQSMYFTITGEQKSE